MTTANLFDNVMRNLWGDNEANDDIFVTSVVDRVRKMTRNPENAFEVIDLMGPDYCTFMETRGAEDGDPTVSVTTIKFRDGSSALIIGNRGIGSGVEVL